jgi:hypothetical protein
MEGAGLLGMLLGQVGSLLLALARMLGGPALYLWLQARALWRWGGAWRLAALPPVALMGAAVIYPVRIAGEGSNLAPMVVILALPASLLWLVIAGAIRGRAIR